MRKTSIAIVVMCLVVLAWPCHGWGPHGHRIIGDIATKYLSAKSKAAIRDLLGEQTLADAGNWADDIRKDPNYDFAKPLHFINVPRSESKVNLNRDCDDEKCVVAAINKYAAILRNKQNPISERIEALKFLIHFVGDVHQPLHVSYQDDRGGNFVRTQFLNEGERNLHSVWDDGLIEHRMKGDRQAMVKDLHKGITDANLRNWSAVTKPIEWANESLAITRELYKEVPAQKASAESGEPSALVVIIDEAYCQRHIGTVEERLSAAGVRLAMMLNSIFDDGKPARPPRTPTRKPQATTQPAETPGLPSMPAESMPSASDE